MCIGNDSIVHQVTDQCRFQGEAMALPPAAFRNEQEIHPSGLTDSAVSNALSAVKAGIQPVLRHGVQQL